jgi:hypothetical protein
MGSMDGLRINGFFYTMLSRLQSMFMPKYTYAFYAASRNPIPSPSASLTISFYTDSPKTTPSSTSNSPHHFDLSLTELAHNHVVKGAVPRCPTPC